jgi:hypothetical protein
LVNSDDEIRKVVGGGAWRSASQRDAASFAARNSVNALLTRNVSWSAMFKTGCERWKIVVERASRGVRAPTVQFFSHQQRPFACVSRTRNSITWPVRR